MENAEFINAKKSLCPNSIKQFKLNQTDDTNVVMYIEELQVMFEKSMSDLRNFFEDETIEALDFNDNCVISFITDDKILQILGIDYRWWIAPVRGKKYKRLEKLFDETEQKTEFVKKVDKKKEYRCACGIEVDGVIKNIDVFTGNKKELINFINKSYQAIQIRSMFSAKIVFCLDYIDESSAIWSTMDELIEKGVFEV